MMPFKYLKFVTVRGKKMVSWRLAIAFIISLVATLIFGLFPDLNLFGKSGFVDKIGNLTSTLTGFYVAALVAVTTFGQGLPEMDGKMPSGQIYLHENGRRVDVSRREYLTALFGYLVFLAFLVSIVSIVVPLVGSAVRSTSFEIIIPRSEHTWKDVSRFIASLLYFWLIIHLAMETSVGLDYLVDKIYRKHPKVKSGTLKLNQNTADNQNLE